MFAGKNEPVRSAGADGFRNVAAAQATRQSSDERRDMGRMEASRETDRPDVDLEKVAVLGYN